jgi:hypothetical protein
MNQNILQQALQFLRNKMPTSTYTDMPQAAQSPARQANLPIQAPQQPQMAQPQAMPSQVPEERLRQNIASTWGQDTPLLQNLALYLQAGNQLPGKMDKLLPIALALRETQGGKDLAKRKWGKNNVGNLRNETGAFQDYPDLAAAVLGNINQGGQSGGIAGLLAGTKPSSAKIYEEFRKTNNYADLFKRWSPPSDNNGTLDEQTRNIEYILGKLRQ